MRGHAVVAPQFWTGKTGKFLRQHPDAQRLAFYLITCPSSNMIGLYYLPLPTLCHELGMTLQGASKALQRVFEGEFAAYDEASETVFVYEMAKFQIGDELNAKDNRVKAVEKLAESYRKSCYFNDFLDRYKDIFNLGLEPNGTPHKQAPSKPLRSQEQEQEQEQEKESTSLASEENGQKQDPYPELFGSFWQIYPARNGRRVGKDKAFAIWQTIPAGERESLLSAAANYSKSLTVPAKDGFTPAPRDAERFLKANWWKDWIDSAQEPTAVPSSYKPLTPPSKD